MTSDILLLNGADPKILNGRGTTAFQLAQNRKENNFRNSFNDNILDWFVDLRPLRLEEKSLHKYAKEGKYMGISILCKKGIDVRVKDVNNNGVTALHLAVTAKWHVEATIQALVRCGADVNAKDADENTPLHIAILQRQDAASITLLLNSADPFIANKDGWTPFLGGSITGTDLVKRVLASHHLDWYRSGMMML